MGIEASTVRMAIERSTIFMDPPPMDTFGVEHTSSSPATVLVGASGVPRRETMDLQGRRRRWPRPFAREPERTVASCPTPPDDRWRFSWESRVVALPPRSPKDHETFRCHVRALLEPHERKLAHRLGIDGPGNSPVRFPAAAHCKGVQSRQARGCDDAPGPAAIGSRGGCGPCESIKAGAPPWNRSKNRLTLALCSGRLARCR